MNTYLYMLKIRNNLPRFEMSNALVQSSKTIQNNKFFYKMDQLNM